MKQTAVIHIIDVYLNQMLTHLIDYKLYYFKNQTYCKNLDLWTPGTIFWFWPILKRVEDLTIIALWIRYCTQKHDFPIGFDMKQI